MEGGTLCDWSIEWYYVESAVVSSSGTMWYYVDPIEWFDDQSRHWIPSHQCPAEPWDGKICNCCLVIQSPYDGRGLALFGIVSKVY